MPLFFRWQPAFCPLAEGTSLVPVHTVDRVVVSIFLSPVAILVVVLCLWFFANVIFNTCSVLLYRDLALRKFDASWLAVHPTKVDLLAPDQYDYDFQVPEGRGNPLGLWFGHKDNVSGDMIHRLSMTVDAKLMSEAAMYWIGSADSWVAYIPIMLE